MADVSSTLRLWTAIAANNNPSGTTLIGANLDDNIRQIQAVVRQFLASPATDMPAASTLDLSTADGFYINVTGTTAITSFGTEGSGIHYLLKFAGALTLTHNATSLILPGGANISTAAGDLAWMISEGGGNWRCVFYDRANAVLGHGNKIVPQSSSSMSLRNNADSADNLLITDAGNVTVRGTLQGAASSMMSPITNSLSGDVSLSSTLSYFDGPSIAQGTSGTWFVVGQVTLKSNAVETCHLKLHDGTTIIASGVFDTDANGTLVSLSGFITNPAGNIRISVKDTASGNGLIKANLTGNSKDSTITAIRIA